MIDIDPNVFNQVFRELCQQRKETWNYRRRHKIVEHVNTPTESRARRESIVEEASGCIEDSQKMAMTNGGGFGGAKPKKFLTNKSLEFDFPNKSLAICDDDEIGKNANKSIAIKKISLANRRMSNVQDMVKSLNKTVNTNETTVETKNHQKHQRIVSHENDSSASNDDKQLMNRNGDYQMIEETTTVVTTTVTRTQKRISINPNASKSINTSPSKRSAMVYKDDEATSPTKRSKLKVIGEQTSIILSTPKGSQKMFITQKEMKQEVYAQIPKKERAGLDLSKLKQVSVNSDQYIEMKLPVTPNGKSKQLALTHTPNKYTSDIWAYLTPPKKVIVARVRDLKPKD